MPTSAFAPAIDRTFLLLSLQRALLGGVHPQLRQASIEADTTALHLCLRFEYDRQPDEEAREAASISAAEVMATCLDHGRWTSSTSPCPSPSD